MPKLHTIIAILLSISSLILSQFISVNAGYDGARPPQQPIIQTSTSSLVSNNSQSQTTPKKQKIKIVDGEIDYESETKLDKKSQDRYDNCKKEVSKKRTKRNKNKPTPCVKNPTQVNDHITDEDYNVLWDSVNQQIEINNKVDQNIERPISDYLTSEQLLEANTSSSSSSLSSLSSNSDSNSSVNSQSSLIFSSSIITIQNSSSSSLSISSILPSVISLSSSSNLESSSKVSLLESIFNFGAIKVSAGVEDGFRLPYTGGAQPKLTSKAYDLNVPTHINYSAFDFISNGFSTDILAAKTGKVIFDADTSGGFGKHLIIKADDGSLAIYAHLDSKNVSLNNTVSRGTKIGVEGSTGNVTGQHLHFETLAYAPCSGTTLSCWGSADYKNAKLLPKFDECYADRGGNANTIPDCSNGYPNNVGFWYQSINYPMADITMTQVQPPLNDWQRSMDSGCTLNSIVVIKQRYGNDCQKMKFNWGDSSIRNPFGQCLDAGNMNGSQKLTFYTCNGSNNQRWRHDGGNGRIWTLQKDNSNRNRCIEYSALNNGDEVYILPCSNDSRQKWYSGDLGIAQESLPTTTPTYNKYMFKRTGTTQCLDMYAPSNYSKVDTWTCNSSDNDQIFEAVPGVNGSFAYRRIGTNFCVDAWNPSNNTSVYAWTCDYNASNHNWYYNWSSKMFQQRNTSQCLAKWNPTTGSQINTWGCNNSDGNLMWDAVQV
jgi:Peptidase family M23/Ricin-type beta-trefoil lectin domain